MTPPPQLVSADDRETFVESHPAWTLDGETISRTFVFRDFNAAIGFVVRTAMLCEVADHHPDIDIRWNKVTMALTTHSAGGLTQKDTALAASFDEIAAI